MSASNARWLVQRRIRAVWRDVHSAETDEAAAQLARALIGQSPMLGVRILLTTSGRNGEISERVVWEYEGREQELALAHEPHPGPSPSREAVARLEGAFETPVLREDERRTRKTTRRYLTALTLVVGVSILLFLSLQLPSLPAPDALRPAQRRSRAIPAPTPERVSHLQRFTARRYAYMSCVHENLRDGLHLVEDADRTGAVPKQLLQLYRDQYRDVLNEFLAGRRQLAQTPAEKGGLPPDQMDFIDDWYRMNHNMLRRSRNFADIINPEDFCRKEAESGNYLEAYTLARRNAPPHRAPLPP